MDFTDNPSRAELSRLLVPADDESGARADGSVQAVRLVGHAATLLDAAGVRLEDVIVREDDGRELEKLLRGGLDALLVCAARDRVPRCALSLAIRSARAHGLTVLCTAHQGAGPASWLRRVFDPLGHRPRKPAT